MASRSDPRDHHENREKHSNTDRKESEAKQATKKCPCTTVTHILPLRTPPLATSRVRCVTECLHPPAIAVLLLVCCFSMSRGVSCCLFSNRSLSNDCRRAYVRACVCFPSSTVGARLCCLFWGDFRRLSQKMGPTQQSCATLATVSRARARAHTARAKGRGAGTVAVIFHRRHL